jgi:hypothetical protein
LETSNDEGRKRVDGIDITGDLNLWLGNVSKELVLDYLFEWSHVVLEYARTVIVYDQNLVGRILLVELCVIVPMPFRFVVEDNALFLQNKGLLRKNQQRVNKDFGQGIVRREI